MADTDIWSYEISGTAANDQTWVVEGVVQADFTELWGIANRNAFNRLTQGRAVYGYPGLGCTGPYKTTKLTFIKGRD